MPRDTEVERLVNGLGVGEGSISGLDASPETQAKLESAIYDPRLLVDVDCGDDGNLIDDDGCSDGREAGLVFTVVREFKRSLRRPKIFGGAVAMTAASRIGRGLAKDRTLNGVFDDAIDELEAKEINYGAHTDENGCDKNCGCGAIDKAPQAVEAAVKYEDQIRDAIALLTNDTEGLDQVYENYRDYASSLPDQPVYSGQKVMERIINQGKVVKKLVGEHRERGIILNNVEKRTVDQDFVRKATNGNAQVFALDVWRLKEVAAKKYPDNPQMAQKAFLSKLVYTLGVAAILTKGDLPVYLVNPADQPQPALT